MRNYVGEGMVREMKCVACQVWVGIERVTDMLYTVLGIGPIRIVYNCGGERWV